MSHVTAAGEKKPCVLEMADASPASRAESPPEPRPCALLCADATADGANAPGAPQPPPAPTPVPSAPPEDESADPVGDGHSDAEWAERHPQGG
ncbi:hypothetical protein ACFJGX_12980 [Hydrogenophaga sp. UC242_50]|jgi:hypothetical protein|uniref:hypothetical protein n=1 Tax=unclassified Hydrogenophaga TaxID=2610897 RepID=UPI0036D37197